MAAHQAAGSCHKGPARASTRAGPNGPKIVKNSGLLPPGSFKALPEPIGFPTTPGRCPGCRIVTAHGRAAAAIAARGGEGHYVRRPRRGRRGARLNRGISADGR